MKKQEELLQRIKIIMEYDLKKTYSENLNLLNEQDPPDEDEEFVDAKNGDVEHLTDDQDKSEGYTHILTPNKKSISVPIGTKILTTHTEKSWNRSDKSWNNFNIWDKAGVGDWIPQDLSNVIEPGSVGIFQLPNGEIYNAYYGLPSKYKLNGGNGGYDKKMLLALTPKPEEFGFLGYHESKTGKVYKTEQPSKPLYDKVFTWIKGVVTSKKFWKEVAWITAAVAFAYLTAGIGTLAIGSVEMASAIITVESLGISVTTRALIMYFAEAGVWSLKAGVEYMDTGDKEAAMMDLTFGFVLPLIHGSYRGFFGSSVTNKEIAELMAKTKGLNLAEFERLWKLPISEGGFTRLQRRIARKLFTFPEKNLEPLLKAKMDEAAKYFTSKGINPSTKLQEYLLKTSDYVSRRWFRRIPTMLAHDLVLLHNLDKIYAAIGLGNEDKLDLNTITNVYSSSTPEEKTKFMDELVKKAQETGQVNDINKVAQDRLKLKKVEGGSQYEKLNLNKVQQDSAINKDLDLLNAPYDEEGK